MTRIMDLPRGSLSASLSFSVKDKHLLKMQPSCHLLPLVFFPYLTQTVLVEKPSESSEQLFVTKMRNMYKSCMNLRKYLFESSFP